MKVLVLGGTLFLGRHVVETALDRGDEVTLFNRGLTNPGLFLEVEKLQGDRDGDLDALKGRSWDAVVDTSGYVPRVVRSTAEVLADAVERYAFVSSVSVYADMSRPGLDESAPVLELSDGSDENVKENYGALKVGCERVVQEVFGDRSILVRAGLIVGPHDPTNRFTYWVTRMAEGGRVLAPEPRDQPVQFVDARDLSAWMLNGLESSTMGAYNVTGPGVPITIEDTLHGIRAALSSKADLVWVDEDFLVKESVQPWTELPLWLAPGSNPDHRGFLALDNRRALDAGLRFRPLSETVRDTLASADSEEVQHTTPSGVGRAGLDPEREAELLNRWDSGEKGR